MKGADVLVIGAGFGGLGAALTLAEAGARVLVCEALTYPGGCASTFQRRGHRFEAGATLSSGLAPHQAFGRWIARYGLDVAVEPLDPVLEVRAPGLRLRVPGDRDRFVDTLCALPDAPVPALRRFFADQRAWADTLWALFDDPALLPPFSAPMLGRHLLRTPKYASLLPVVGRSMQAVLARYRLDRFAPLTTWLRGLCQITVQCPPEAAEAPFALAAMDYLWRGTGHIRGGMGALAAGMATAVTRAGGEVRFATRVQGLRRDGGVWIAQTRTGEVRAPVVISNQLPGDLGASLGGDAALEARHTPVAEAWGAVMLYRVVRAAPGPAHHHDLSAHPERLDDGHHVFVSVGGAEDGRGEGPGERVLTASTHIALASLRTNPAARVAEVQARMRATMAALLPELEDVVVEHTASPRTFARFTRRRDGAVGGVPRHVGLAAYGQLGPVSPRPGLWLVGDSVFPGQSTYATAVGGARVAAAVLGVTPPARTGPGP